MRQGQHAATVFGANSILLDFPEHSIVLGAVHQGVSAMRVALSSLRGHIIDGTTPRELWECGDEALAISRRYAKLRSRLNHYLFK